MKPLVSSVRVERAGVHDVVGVWNRGGRAGLLTVAPGDGYAIAARLAGRAPAVSDTACDHESAADVVSLELGNVREAVTALAKIARKMTRDLDANTAEHLGGSNYEAQIDPIDEMVAVALGRLVAAVEALPR